MDEAAMIKKCSMWSLAATAIVATAPDSASAQGANESWFQRNRYVAVTERYQPAYDPEQRRIGGFVANAAVRTGVEYRSNVFASQTGETSDGLFFIEPRAAVRTDLSRHEFGIEGRAAHREFFDTGSETSTDVAGSIYGRLDVTQNFTLTARGRAAELFEPRISVEADPLSNNPVELDTFGGSLQARYVSGRVQATVTGRQDRFDFNDVGTSTGGIFDQDFRDRTETGVLGRVAYAVQRDYALFVEGEYVERDHDSPTFPDTLNRDGEDYAVRAGFDFELPVLLRGELGVGYFTTDQADPTLNNVNGLSLEGEVTWFATRLTTVTGRASRRVVSGDIVQSSSRTDLNTLLRVDHELRRNVLLFAEGGLITREFNNLDRDDDRFSGRVGGVYKLNKHVHAQLAYRYIDETSSGADTGNEFQDHRATFALTFFP